MWLPLRVLCVVISLGVGLVNAAFAKDPIFGQNTVFGQDAADLLNDRYGFTIALSAVPSGGLQCSHKVLVPPQKFYLVCAVPDSYTAVGILWRADVLGGLIEAWISGDHVMDQKLLGHGPSRCEQPPAIMLSSHVPGLFEDCAVSIQGTDYYFSLLTFSVGGRIFSIYVRNGGPTPTNQVREVLRKIAGTITFRTTATISAR